MSLTHQTSNGISKVIETGIIFLENQVTLQALLFNDFFYGSGFSLWSFFVIVALPLLSLTNYVFNALGLTLQTFFVSVSALQALLFLSLTNYVFYALGLLFVDLFCVCFGPLGFSIPFSNSLCFLCLGVVICRPFLCLFWPFQALLFLSLTF